VIDATAGGSLAAMRAGLHTDRARSQAASMRQNLEHRTQGARGDTADRPHDLLRLLAALTAERLFSRLLKLVLPEGMYWPGLGLIAGLLVLYTVASRSTRTSCGVRCA
jgi:hypothetical protein